MRTDLLEKKNQILACIENNMTLSLMSIIFNCKIETLKRYLKKLGIEYAGDQGKAFRLLKRNKISALEYSKKINCSPVKLKYKLIEEGIKERKCERCGLSEWMGEAIPLQLHHEDGNRANNNFSNLKLLCMNCHGQTENFGSKNKNRKINEHLISPLIKEIKEIKNKKEQKLNRPKRKYTKLSDEQRKLKYQRKYGSETDYHNAIKNTWEQEQQKYISLVLNSGIDFSKFGWVNKVAPIINQKIGKVNKWMKRIMPDFYKEKCFKRNNAPIEELA